VNKLRGIALRIDALDLRTRVVAFVMLLVGMVSAWDALLYVPLDNKRERLVSRSVDLHRGLQDMFGQTNQYLDEQKRDPDASNRGRLSELRQRAQGTQSALNNLMAGLVPPQEVPLVLERMLDRETGLTLIKLEGLGPVRLNPVGTAVSTNPEQQPKSPANGASAAPATKQGASELKLYRHGMKITFEGRYMAALRYLSALEQSSWRLFWDAVELDVQVHPKARVSITVFSLSTDDAWIGV
jgi:MSHA biogenesis protein MshJ